MAIVSRLLPLRYLAEARRFRPGLDYTLATSEEKEASLDVVLGLTPDMKVKEGAGSGSGSGSSTGKGEQEMSRWRAAEWGGWEVYPLFFVLLPGSD
jgi:hypothetical protein